MNCIEFRRGYTIEPKMSNALMVAHQHECPACARFARKIDGFEEQLRKALAVQPPASLFDRIGWRVEREEGPVSQAEFDCHLGRALQVDIPRGLEERIVLRRAAEQAHKRQRWLVSLALVAGVTAAVGLTTTLSQPGQGLAKDLIAHVEQEPQALMSQLEVSHARLGMALRAVGIALDGDIGQVTYAGLCRVRNGLGVHLVVAGQSGPITVLILPTERLEAARTFEQGHHRGIVIPGDRGSVAVVGHPNEPLQPIAYGVNRALRWTI